jgi:SAM-dependent methyltransferase/uncharacterized protein YbaR (Trm112 family)
LQTVLDKLVLGKMGNRALAERAAREYARAPSQRRANLEARDIRWRRLALLPLAIPLALAHALALSLNLCFLLAVYATMPDKSRFDAYRRKWTKLAEHWAKLPACFVYKAAELALYHEHVAAHGRGAIEIGVYTGETSRAFFLGQRLDVGVEYNIERFLIYKDGGPIHDRLFSADIRRLPFADSAFSSAYCIHSVDDMELPAETALRELGRIVRPGGHVFFSGLTLNFARHNLLIRLCRWLGLARLGDAIFRYVYIGSFNHHARGEWQDILSRCGLDLIEYRTYVPFHYAGVFDLAYRPETVLTNLCGWKRWLEPLARTAWFRGLLFRATAAMLRLSEKWTHRDEGINFFAVARKAGSPVQSPSAAGSRDRDILCVRCGNALEMPGDIEQARFLDCAGCGVSYPVVEGVPVLLDLQAERDALLPGAT